MRPLRTEIEISSRKERVEGRRERDREYKGERREEVNEEYEELRVISGKRLKGIQLERGHASLRNCLEIYWT